MDDAVMGWDRYRGEGELELCLLSNNKAEFTIEQFIAALESTTTLTGLKINFEEYEPTPANNRRVIEPLCRCISNLRLRNAQHPLRELILYDAEFDVNGMLDVFEKLLVAAKQFEIFHMGISLAYGLPVQFLVKIFRDNNSPKVLDLAYVTFSCGAAALPLPPNDGPPNESIILTQDKLTMDTMRFDNSTAATAFATLVAHTNISSLKLGRITAHQIIDMMDVLEDDNDTQITARILSELQIPSVERLLFYDDCGMEHFKAALEAGTTTVTDLDAYVSVRWNWYETASKTSKLELIASFIRRSVTLNRLRILLRDCDGPHIRLPPLFFQAMESCATATHIDVEAASYNNGAIPNQDLRLSPYGLQHLQKIASRNRELDRFATNPGTYPTEELPELMRQFDSCPTGLYMLARRLPEVLSFDELYAVHLSRRQTNPPTPKNAKRD